MKKILIVLFSVVMLLCCAAIGASATEAPGELQNVALNKPVAGYSSTVDEWGCHHTYINDGTGSVWASALWAHWDPNSIEWITIDLEEVYEISSVKLVPQLIGQYDANAFPEEYEIQVSLDGESFVTVKSVTGDNVPPSEAERVLEFDAVKARYVRLYATKLTRSSNDGYSVEIKEMEVYGREAELAEETYVYVNSLDGETVYTGNLPLSSDISAIDAAIIATLNNYANGAYNSFVKFEEISCEEGVHTFYSVHNTTAAVTATGGTATEADGYYVLTADAPAEGQYFVGWYDGDTLLSYSATCKFFPDEVSESVTAKFAAEEAAKKSMINVENDRVVDKLTVKVTPTYGDDKVIVDYGYYVATSDNAMTASMVIAANRKLESHNPHAYMVRTHAIADITKAQNIYLVGFYTYVDDLGKTKTSYTDLITVQPIIKIVEGENIALNKPVAGYSSTTDEWGCHHTYINDGTEAVWASALWAHWDPNSIEWITIDLEEVYVINTVKLLPQEIGQYDANGFLENYEIQVSLDGESFVTVKSVTGDNVPPSEAERVLEFDTVKARYVRLYATKLTRSSNDGYSVEIKEMEVFYQNPNAEDFN